jgi:hypothetical protein
MKSLFSGKVPNTVPHAEVIARVQEAVTRAEEPISVLFEHESVALTHEARRRRWPDQELEAKRLALTERVRAWRASAYKAAVIEVIDQLRRESLGVVEAT